MDSIRDTQINARECMPSGGALARLRSSSTLAASLAALFLLLSGCAERPPQYQVIPAVMDGDVEKVEALLRDKANVDVNWRAGGGGITALHSAAYRNQTEIIELLLRYGADPNIATRDGEAPLLAAAYSGHVEVVRLLLEAGADVNAAEMRYGSSPLSSAAWKGHTDVVKVLLEHGADRAYRTASGLSAEDWARRYGHDEVVELLTSYWPQAAPAAETVANPPAADAAAGLAKD